MHTFFETGIPQELNMVRESGVLCQTISKMEIAQWIQNDVHNCPIICIFSSMYYV